MAHDSTREPRRARCPENVLAWIPWYADGGLDDREMGAVEAHAAECSECRRELDLVAGAPWALEGVELPDRERLFDEITARIEADEQGGRARVIPIARGRGVSAEELGRIEAWLLDPRSEREAELAEAPDDRRESDGSAGRATDVGSDAGNEAPSALVEPLPGARLGGRRLGSPVWAAAAALVLLALGGLAGAQLEKLRSAGSGALSPAPAAYQLATAPPGDAALAAPMLDVVFSDSVSARQIWSALRSLDVEIVSGPTNLGVYRLRLLPSAAEGRDPTTADAAAIAARLVAPDSPIAIFAEPVP
jgi:hypothetical protein